jgi:hypothetical protein
MEARVGQRVNVPIPFHGVHEGRVTAVDNTELLPVIVDIDGAEYATDHDELIF